MKILAHRGFWSSTRGGNSVDAFAEASRNGFGIETDFRDFLGELVVSHDPVVTPNVSASRFFREFARPGPLAINVKADGIAALVAKCIREQSIDDYFVFDMSIPETLRYLDIGLNVFLRVSEYEVPSPLLGRAAGIWLDYFGKDDWLESDVVDWLAQGKKVCIVSPELHRRDHWECWSRIIERLPIHDENLMICTDLPDEFLAECLKSL